MVVWIDPYRFASSGGPEFTDDFNRANSSSPGADWVEVGAGNWSITLTSRLTLGVNTGEQCMYVNALSTSDHYAQADSVAHTIDTYLIIRSTANNLSPLTFYFAGVNGSGNYAIGKYDGGSYTGLASAAGSSPAGKTLRFEASGGDLSLKVNGVEVLGVTDGSPLSGLYVGVWGAGNPTSYDNFEAGAIA